MHRLGSTLLRGNLAPALLLAGIASILFAPYFLKPGSLIHPNSGFSSDLEHYFLPSLTAWAEALADGRTLLWDDSIASGQPISMVGDLRSYPFSLLFLALQPSTAITVLAAGHIFLGGMFCYYLVRAVFSASRLAALVSSLSFMLMPKLMAHLAGGHLPNVFGLAWMPAILLGAWDALRSRRAHPAILAGLALTLQLPTHPQIVISSLYMLAGMLSWRWWTVLRRSGWRGREFRETMLWIPTTISIIGVTAIGVGSMWWLTLAGLLPWTAAIDFDGSIQSWYRLPPAVLLSLFVPTDLQFPEWMIYSGAVPLLLALLALEGHRRRQAIYLWIAVSVTLLIVLGEATPLYTVARRLVPALGLFRTRTRLWFLGGFALTLLSGLGLDALRKPDTWERFELKQKWYRLGATSYLWANLLAVLGLHIYTHRVPVEALRAATAGGMFLLLLWLWRRHRPSWLVGAVLVVTLLLLDLLPLASGFMRPVAPDVTTLSSSPSAEFISEHSGIYRVYSPDWTLPYTLATALQIDLMHGLAAVQMAPVATLIKHASGCELTGYATGMPPCLSGEIDPRAYREAVPEPRLLGLLNVRFVISGFPLAVPGLEAVFSANEVTVYENTHFLPRAFLVEQVEAVSSSKDIFDNLGGADLARVAFIEESQDPPVLPAGVLDSSVISVARDSGSISLAVQVNRDALLVYSESWAPGWKATVNGKAARVLRTDGALLGVVVPAGSSLVVLQYKPLAFRIGWRISLISLAAIAVVVTLGHLASQRVNHTTASLKRGQL